MPAPRVLITRSPHQASALADQLRALGVDPILIPTIELADPTIFAPLDQALARLDSFHWLLFTSANAVEAFHRRLSGVPQNRVPRVRIFGPGGCSPATSASLPPTLSPQAKANPRQKTLSS